MKYFLHAFCVAPFDGLRDTVNCCQVLEWEIVGLGDEPRVLHTLSYFETMKKTQRKLLSSWRLIEGSRFYIVKNDPTECQEPNGQIVWRWDEKVQDTHDGKSLEAQQ